MIICLNPNCQKPENADGRNFCLSCGTGLVPLLRDRYRIISLLGSGGFGRTFLAEDTDMPSARRCVIKQLKPITNNPQIYQLVQERFQREAAVLEQLGEGNSNIPSLYGYFTLNSQFYLVQQWIDGEPLTNIIKQQGTLSESYVREFITKVLEILDYVHSKGIIHRDIKPDNIIVRSQSVSPVLIDFGAVRETMGTMVTSQGIPTSSIVIGTPGYMPNEQAAGKPVYSSDLYSFGLTAIYALTGKIPQELPLDQDTGNVIWHPYTQNVSPELIAILDKTIRSYPQERYPKAKDLLDALQSGVSTIPFSQQQSVSHSTPTAPISLTQQPVSHNTNSTPPLQVIPQPVVTIPPTQPDPQHIQGKRKPVKSSPHPLSPIYRWVLGLGVGIAAVAGVIFLNQHSSIQGNPSTTSSPSTVNTPPSYAKLRELLAAGQWKEADIETGNVMLKVAGRTKEGYLDLNACRNFPSLDLRTIDQLWLKYSDNKFGFSVQKEIWVAKGGKLDGRYDYDTYVKLGDEVGWRQGGNWLSYNDLTFDKTNAKRGHLPVTTLQWWGGVRGGEVTLLSSLNSST